MPSPKGVPVQLDKKRTLRYTWRALVKMEEATGLTAAEAAEAMAKGSLSTISAVIWAGLLHSEPELTLDDTLDLVDIRRLEEISEAVGEAFADALGSEEEEEAPGDSKKKGSKKN